MIRPILSPLREKTLRPVLECSGSAGSAPFLYPTENLIGHWTDEAIISSSREAIDYSSNANNATLSADFSANGGGFNRPTNTTFNIPSLESFEAPYVVDYDLLRTIMFWYYYQDADITIIDGNWHTLVVASGLLDAPGMFLPTYYVNGVVSNVLTSGWNFITVVGGSGFNMGPIRVNGDQKLDKLSIYGDGKDATVILETFDRTKSTYLAPGSLITVIDGYEMTIDGYLITLVP